MRTSHVRYNRVCSGVCCLSQAQAAHMEVDRHLEFAPDVVILCTGWMLSDHALHMPQTSHTRQGEVDVMRIATCYGCCLITVQTECKFQGVKQQLEPQLSSCTRNTHNTKAYRPDTKLGGKL